MKRIRANAILGFRRSMHARVCHCGTVLLSFEEKWCGPCRRQGMPINDRGWWWRVNDTGRTQGTDGVHFS